MTTEALRSLFHACTLKAFIFWITRDVIGEIFACIDFYLWMFKILQNMENCVVHSLSERDVKAAEIYRQISKVYGENVMVAGTVRKLVRAFRNATMRNEVGNRPLLIMVWWRKLM
ncbi:hypothetical protein Trydic_g11413 [Trypoxylus dichotomus]